MIERRELFKSFSKNGISKEILRPPYGSQQDTFLKECLECGEKFCLSSCDENIIFMLDDGTPSLNFSISGCTFCEECANVCSLGVLSLENVNNLERINAEFKISLDGCVAHNGVICFSCKEPCIDDAILFNGLFNPIIDTDRCTACGFCLSRCPADAISYNVKKLKVEDS